MIVGNYRGGLSYYKGDTSMIHNGIKTTINLPSSIIQLFPNPAKKYVNILFSEDEITTIELIIYNGSGKIMYRNSFKNKKQITLFTNDCNNGIYFLKIEYIEQSLMQITTHKFVIAH